LYGLVPCNSAADSSVFAVAPPVPVMEFSFSTGVLYGLVYCVWQVVLRYRQRHASVGHSFEIIDFEYMIVEEVTSLARTTPAVLSDIKV
jgi:hypothetical protein